MLVALNVQVLSTLIFFYSIVKKKFNKKVSKFKKFKETSVLSFQNLLF